jgi:hypothetical protein
MTAWTHESVSLTEEEEVTVEGNRKQKRRQLIYNLRVYDRVDGRFVGLLVDVTTDGMMLLTKERIQEKRDFQMKLVSPYQTGGDDSVIFDAKSIWSRKDVDPEFFATGFQLRAIDQKDVARIKGLIKEFGSQYDGDPRR